MKLKLGEGLTIPIEVAGQAVALVGIRGSGKTNTAGVIAEELLDHGQQIVVIDPTDAWWGLRSKYPVFIFGGPHGDLELTENDGKTLAEFVVQERVPIILSLRHLRKGAQRRLITEFCEDLYHLKGRPEYRTALTVFIDEAPQFIPQRVMGEMARLVGAVQDMILLGRSVGFGVVMISQRFATLNADVRTQADTVIVHRLPSPLDRKALNEWIEENASIAEQKEVLSSLATLKTGEAWLWAPYFDLFKRQQIRARRTFDSSAAPKRGAAPIVPKDLTKIDREKLKGKLAAAIEKAKADDPKELKRQIAELQRQVKSFGDLKQKPETVKKVEVPALTDADRALIEKLSGRLAELEAKLTKYQEAAQQALDDRLFSAFATFIEAGRDRAAAHAEELKGILEAPSVKKLLEKLNQLGSNLPPAPSGKPSANYAGIMHNRGNAPENANRPAVSRVQVLRSQAPKRQVPSSNGDATLPPARQKILNGLAFLEAIGVPQADKTQLALIVGVSPTSGSYFNNLGALRTAGLIDYPNGGTAALTKAGRAESRLENVPTTTEELHAAIRSKLPPAKWKILQALISAYPDALPKDKLAESIDVSPTSGSYFNNLGSLRSLGLLDYPRPSEAIALPVLFLEGR